jgi:hypothetical protein
MRNLPDDRFFVSGSSKSMGRSPCSLFVYSLAMFTDVVAYECYDLALVQIRAAVRGAGKADAPAVFEIGGNG